MILESTGNSTLKYKIYDIIDGKKKLSKKGTFKNRCEVTYAPKSEKTIVRIVKTNNFFLAFILWLLYIPMLCFSDASHLPEGIYREIIIKNPNGEKDLLIRYDQHNHDLTCSNASFLFNEKGIKRARIIALSLFISFFVLLIALCVIFRFDPYI